MSFPFKLKFPGSCKDVTQSSNLNAKKTKNKINLESFLPQALRFNGSWQTTKPYG